MRACLPPPPNRLREGYGPGATRDEDGSATVRIAKVYADSQADADWTDGVPWFRAARPDGARSLPPPLRRSVIGVVGTALSGALVLPGHKRYLRDRRVWLGGVA